MSRVSYDGGRTFKVFEKPEDVKDVDAHKFLKTFMDKSVMARNYNGDKMLTPVRVMIIPVTDRIGKEMAKHRYWSLATHMREAAKDLLGLCGDVDFIADLGMETVFTVKCDTAPCEPEYFVVGGCDTMITL